MGAGGGDSLFAGAGVRRGVRAGETDRHGVLTHANGRVRPSDGLNGARRDRHRTARNHKADGRPVPISIGRTLKELFGFEAGAHEGG